MRWRRGTREANSLLTAAIDTHWSLVLVIFISVELVLGGHSALKTVCEVCYMLYAYKVFDILRLSDVYVASVWRVFSCNIVLIETICSYAQIKASVRRILIRPEALDHKTRNIVDDLSS